MKICQQTRGIIHIPLVSVHEDFEFYYTLFNDVHKSYNYKQGNPKMSVQMILNLTQLNQTSLLTLASTCAWLPQQHAILNTSEWCNDYEQKVILHGL